MVMMSNNYWMLRHLDALENARRAQSEQSRAAYVDLARHYRSMHDWVSGPRGRDREPAIEMPAVPAADTAIRGFSSIHDILLQAA